MVIIARIFVATFTLLGIVFFHLEILNPDKFKLYHILLYPIVLYICFLLSSIIGERLLRMILKSKKDNEEMR